MAGEEGDDPPPAARARLPRLLLLAGLFLGLAAGALVWRGVQTPSPRPLLAAVDIQPPSPLTAFALQDAAGGRFTNADLIGRWSIIFFGYTYCPDICPTALTTLVQMRNELVRQGVAPPHVVFISVDPKRDQPEMLRQYARSFDPAFGSVSGSDADLAALIKQLGVYYFRHDKDGDPHYAVDHSAGLYLIDPQGRWRAFFPPPQEGAKLAADFIALTSPR